jgi:hypothetical protein
MSFLVIAGQTVPVMEGQATERIEAREAEHRAFAGNLRTAVQWEKRQWQFTTGLLTQAEQAALRAAVALGAHVACSGDALGGAVTCRVSVGDSGFVSVATTDGLGFMRAVQLVLREV